MRTLTTHPLMAVGALLLASGTLVWLGLAGMIAVVPLLVASGAAAGFANSGST